MKKILIAWLIGAASAASICSGQSVMLKVAPVESARRTTGDNGYYSSSYREVRSQTIKITLTNMHTNAVDYVVEWFFFGKSVGGGGTNSVYDGGQKDVSLARGKFDSFEVQSIEIQSESSDGNRYARGLKTDGYVVVVWAGEKIVGVEASDMSNRRKYSEVKAVKKLQSWNAPPPEWKGRDRTPADKKTDRNQ